jgi:phosphatidylglycerophosphate synthase
MRIMKLMPNALSVFRFFVGIPIVYCILTGRWITVLVLVVLGYLSDLIDGSIARRYHAETSFGKKVDPIADIVFDEALVVGLAVADQVDLRLAILIALAIVVIRLPAYSRSRWVDWSWMIMFFPVYVPSMLWLGSICILRAFGTQGLKYGLILAVSVVGLVMWLKRDRIIQDSKRYLPRFLKKWLKVSA